MTEHAAPPHPPAPGGPTVVVASKWSVNSPLNRLSRRREPEPVAQDAYPRLEVYDDRIRLAHDHVHGQEWFRRDGDRVRYVRGGRFPSVYVGGNAGTGVDTTYFDVERIRAAVLAHGWSWESDGAVTQPSHRPTAAPAAEPVVELVLKEHRGSLNPASWSRGPRAVALLLGAIALGFAIMGMVYLLGPWSMLYFIGIVSVLGCVATVVYVSGYQGLAVSISRSELVVRRGDLIQTAERSRLTGPGQVDKYGVKFKAGKSFRDEVYIPTSRRREELLAQLGAFGWPLTYK